MESWPSTRVPQGGLFAPRVNKYSPETHKLLKVLMEEQKMSMHQRKQVSRCLRDGSSLPPSTPQRGAGTGGSGGPAVEFDPEFAMMAMARSPRRRTQSAIRKSGAYDPPKIPFRPLVDREKAKEHLQNAMTGYDQGSYANYLRGNKGVRRPVHPPRPAPAPEPVSRLDELMDEVKERLAWLDEMAALGQDKPHRETIMQQIAEKMRQIKALKTVPSEE